MEQMNILHELIKDKKFCKETNFYSKRGCKPAKMSSLPVHPMLAEQEAGVLTRMEHQNFEEPYRRD